MIEFKEWIRTQRHPTFLYTDFEALLIKFLKSKSINTSAFRRHSAMSYGIYLKASDNVLVKLLEVRTIQNTTMSINI